MELSISKCLSDDEDDIDIVEDNFDEPLPPAMRDSNGTVGILISPSSKFVRFSGFGNGEDYDDTEFERKGPEITRHDKFHSTICTILRHTSSEVVLRTLSDVGGWGNLFGSLVWVGQREGGELMMLLETLPAAVHESVAPASPPPPPSPLPFNTFLCSLVLKFSFWTFLSDSDCQSAFPPFLKTCHLPAIVQNSYIHNDGREWD